METKLGLFLGVEFTGKTETNFIYDSSGRIIESLSLTKNNTLISREQWKYNDEGNEVEKLTFKEDGEIFQIKKSIYN